MVCWGGKKKKRHTEVGHGGPVANQILALGQDLVHDANDALDLVDVARVRRLDLLRVVVLEPGSLAELFDFSHLSHQPVRGS